MKPLRRTTDDTTTRFSTHAHQAVTVASEEASRLHHRQIDTAHLLLGLLHAYTSSAAQLLAGRGVTLNAARHAVALVSGPAAAEPHVLRIHPDGQRGLQAAMAQAQQRHHPVVDTEHLLLGLLYDDTSHAAQVLQHLNISPQQVRADVETMLHRQAPEDAQND